MTLYEIYYHDPWRTRSTYGRQYITTNFAVGAIVGTIQWLGAEIYFRRNMKSFVLND